MLTGSGRFAFIARRHHAFETTGNAYDVVQTDETIRTGDTLVVLAEQVIGIAMTWPFAVTASAGKLHQIKPGVPGDTLAKIADELGIDEAALGHAVDLAKALGFALGDSLTALMNISDPPDGEQPP